ncbi:MAG: hypothetical protein QXM02_07865 [Thermoproteota archaeon]|nr:hypothetical protein [Candidatus Brockarchaeota archaeon]
MPALRFSAISIGSPSINSLSAKIAEKLGESKGLNVGIRKLDDLREFECLELGVDYLVGYAWSYTSGDYWNLEYEAKETLRAGKIFIEYYLEDFVKYLSEIVPKKRQI